MKILWGAMENHNSRKIVRVLSAPIDVVNWSAVINKIVAWGNERVGKGVYICNVHMAVTATADSNFLRMMERADLVTPDGAPIAWAIRRSGVDQQERINGPDLMWRYLAVAEKNGQIVFFYGGKQAALESLRIELLRSFPCLKIGGMVSPPFRDLTEEEDEFYVRQINSARSAVVFVGLGCPKQEEWIYNHLGRINAVMVGVGAAFDYHAKLIKRAPLWMQNCGLEWFHRLCSEPRRLWKRYLVTNSIFLFKMIGNGFRARH